MRKHRGGTKRLAAFFTAGFVLIQGLSMSMAAETLADRYGSKETGEGIFIQSESYAEVYRDYLAKGYTSAAAEAVVRGADYSEADGEVQLKEYEDIGQTLVFGNDTHAVSWKVDIPKAGLYSLRLKYMALDDSMADIQKAVRIDGESPCAEWESLRLDRFWEDDGETRKNAADDEIRPSVRQLFQWNETKLYDSQGMFAKALTVYLEAGVHTLTLDQIEGAIAIESLAFCPPDTLPAYADVAKGYEEAGYTPAGQPIRVEAENSVWRTDSTVRMVSNAEPTAYPASGIQVRMNSLGGEGWGTGNSAVTWKLYAPESGLYKIMVRVGQNYREGMPSYRRIAIDGKVPFEEFETYRFDYSKKWRSEVLSDADAAPYLVYLDKGDHTLTMTVKQGASEEIIYTLQQDTLRISSLILDILKITGREPDLAYDYELEKKIPGLLDIFRNLSANLDGCMKRLEDSIPSGKMPSVYSQMKVAKEELALYIRNPYGISAKLDSLNNLVTSYGNWVNWLGQQPLILDYLQFLPEDTVVEDYTAGFWQQLKISTINFFASFVKDYDSINGLPAGQELRDTIEIWIGRGKDYGTLLKQMADETFSKDTGIGVQVNIMPAGQLSAGTVNAMMLAISSGAAPDVAVGMPTTSLGEFALRSSVLDLRGMDGFDTVSGWFNEELFRSISYQGGVYGLPCTTAFRAMFYRKDLMQLLGLSLPKTWTEMYERVIPVLSQNNMQLFYAPTMYELMLFQNGGEFYRDGGAASALDTAEAYRAFKEMCDLYTIHGVPVAADSFTRFRTGEIPLVIGDLEGYMKLYAAAPELSGRWGIAALPGHENADGTIDDTQGSGLTDTNAILSQSKNPEASWEFLKWWMAEETQVRFAQNIEAALGKTARWSTANRAAFKQLPWPKEDLPVIESALENVREIPVVLGGYFTTRHVNNAFNRVVVSSMNARDSLERAVKDINKELARKQETAR